MSTSPVYPNKQTEEAFNRLKTVSANRTHLTVKEVNGDLKLILTQFQKVCEELAKQQSPAAIVPMEKDNED